MWWMSTCKMNEICTLQSGMLRAAPELIPFSRCKCLRSHPGRQNERDALLDWQQWQTAAVFSTVGSCSSVPHLQITTPPGKQRFKCEKALGIKSCLGRLKSYEKHLIPADFEGPGKNTTTFVMHALDKTTSRAETDTVLRHVKTNYSVNKSQYAGLYASQSNLLQGMSDSLPLAHNEASVIQQSTVVRKIPDIKVLHI